jgi:hypothetical protein
LVARRAVRPPRRKSRIARKARKATASTPRGSSMRPALARRRNPASSRAAAARPPLSLPVSVKRGHRIRDEDMARIGGNQRSTADRVAGARRLPLRLRDQPRRRDSTTLLVWTSTKSAGPDGRCPTFAYAPIPDPPAAGQTNRSHTKRPRRFPFPCNWAKMSQALVTHASALSVGSRRGFAPAEEPPAAVESSWPPRSRVTRAAGGRMRWARPARCRWRSRWCRRGN